MGRIIRRTVTITITESWTIVWTDDSQGEETTQPQTTTIVSEQSKAQEEEAETILPAVTTGTATDAQPTDTSPKSGRQRNCTCRRPAPG